VQFSPYPLADAVGAWFRKHWLTLLNGDSGICREFAFDLNVGDYLILWTSCARQFAIASATLSEQPSLAGFTQLARQSVNNNHSTLQAS